MDPTEEERKWFARLKRCFKDVPDNVWIFVANDTVNMMRQGKHGKQVMTIHEVVDQDYILAGGFSARVDGGDW